MNYKRSNKRRLKQTATWALLLCFGWLAVQAPADAAEEIQGVVLNIIHLPVAGLLHSLQPAVSAGPFALHKMGSIKTGSHLATDLLKESQQRSIGDFVRCFLLEIAHALNPSGPIETGTSLCPSAQRSVRGFLDADISGSSASSSPAQQTLIKTEDPWVKPIPPLLAQSGYACVIFYEWMVSHAPRASDIHAQGPPPRDGPHETFTGDCDE